MRFTAIYFFVLGLGLSLGSSAILGSTEVDVHAPLGGFKFQKATRLSEPTADKSTTRSSHLRQVKQPSGRRSTISAAFHATDGDEPRQNITTINGLSTQYAIRCGWDESSVWLLLDTGSSDTWSAGRGFHCSDSNGSNQTQSSCGLAHPHISGFSGGEVADVHFALKYGSGEEVVGPMGYSDIACGGLTVSGQQVGLANATSWSGNNVTSGLLGLAYPVLTSAYYGKIGDEAPWNLVTYPPFLTNAISQGSIDPTFSVAIIRNSTDGVLAWGGLPPVSYDRTSVAATDLIIAKLVDDDETAWRYSFYTVVPDGIKWDQTTDETRYPYIVDTGTTAIYLPPPLMDKVANSFEPSAVYMFQWDMYFVDCAAIPPTFAVTIEGVDFWINPADLIVKELVDPMTGYCALGLASGGAGPYILGDVFLQNVVAVFDIGGAQMRFYAQN